MEARQEWNKEGVREVVLTMPALRVLYVLGLTY